MQARSLASPRFGLLLGVCTSLGACAKTSATPSAPPPPATQLTTRAVSAEVDALAVATTPEAEVVAGAPGADTRCIERCEGKEGLERCLITCFEEACAAPAWREPCVPSECDLGRCARTCSPDRVIRFRVPPFHDCASGDPSPRCAEWCAASHEVAIARENGRSAITDSYSCTPTPIEFGLVSRLSFRSCEPRPAVPPRVERSVDPAPR